jgi:tape measure domain-containing protein
VSVVANVAINVDSSGAVSKLRQVQQGAQATSQAVDKLNATTAATSNKFKIAANGIKYFTDAAGRARAENGRFLTSTERAAAGIKAQGRAAQQASGKFNGLRNALASLGAGLAVRKAFVDASELESAQARIGLLTKNFSQLTGIQEVAANAAKKFNLSQAESLGTLTDLGNRIGPTGASLQDVANVYEGFNTLLALNKVNSQNAASATLQLNQALGSGRLAGEEFNAISEATPQLLDAVAKVLGRNRGELKQLASDGKISSQVLIEALTRIRTEGAADLETAFGGAFGATRRFNAALEDFSATVGTELLPALTPLINKATEILKLFGELPGPVKTTAVAILGLTAAFVVLAPAVAAVSLAAAPWLALAAGIAAAGLAILDAANAQRDFNNVIATAPLPDVNAKIQELESKLRAAETKLADVTAQFGPLSREAAFAQASVDGLKGSLDLVKGDYKIRLLFESVGVKPDARFFGPGFAAPAAPTRVTPTPTTGTGTGKGKDDAERKAEEKRRAAEELANLQGQVTLKEKLFGIDKQIAVEKQRGSLVAAAALEMDKALEERQTRIAEITRSTADTATKNAQIKKATLDADKKIFAVQQAIKEQEAERIKSFDAIIADLNLELALKTATTEQAREQLRLEAEIAKIRKDPSLSDPQKTDIERRKRENARPLTEGQKINAELGAVEDELKTLVSLSNQVTSAANAIGTAFGNSFKGLISGSMTAKEALASFFQSVADHFLDMAAQIIAKMIQMFILQQALKIFGGALGGGGGFGAGGAGFGGSNAFSSFDAGGAAAFGMPSLMAQGGFVTGPTSAIIGEGGESEYVIPASKMSAAMSRYSRGARGEGVIAGSGGGTEGESGAAAAGPIVVDVRYSVERINDVEYVTASQFQAGMQQAAQQGAQQGEQRTLRKLQMSNSTRRRVGV